MRTRAWRRAQVERLKKNRRHYWAMGPELGENRADSTPRKLGMVAQTPKPCSCRACGNPRKYEGDTIQQRRQAQKGPQ